MPRSIRGWIRVLYEPAKTRCRRRASAIQEFRTKTSSWFTEHERPGLLDFWRVYDGHFDEVSRDMVNAFAAPPGPEHAFGVTDLVTAHEETRPLIGKAVDDDDWHAYEDRIRRAAVRFAREGVSFDRWYALILAVHDSVGAKLANSFASDAPRLEAAQHAMRRFLDQALAVIAAEFIDAKESVLRDDAALDKKFSAEEARTRIAREMHDELGQQITALKLDLGWLLRRHNTHERDGVGERLHAMTELVDDTMQTVRLIATRLRLPDVLDERGLMDAITALAREVETRSGLHLQLSFPTGKNFRVPVEPATAIFAAFQEVLTNVVRHASAKNVHVRLERTAGGLWLEIEDDGCGITVAQATGGSLGLLGVRERISLVRGTVDVDGESGRGTRVRITVPFEQDTAA